MTVNLAAVRAARYYPELLPGAEERDLSANAEASPPILTISRIADLGLILQLKDIALIRNNNVSLRVRADELFYEAPAGSLFNLETPNPSLFTAKDYLTYNLYSQAAIADYATYCGLWVRKPSIAEKLKYGLHLTVEEQNLARKHDIYDLVKKGNLPLQWDYYFLRTYQVINEEIYAFRGDVSTAGAIVRTLIPKPDEFLVVTAIAAERPPTAAYNTRITMMRDEALEYVDLLTWPLDLTYEIKCFIPVLREIVVKIETATALTNYRMRFRLLRCKLTDVLRIKWDLPREVPRELEEKVKAGLF